MRKKTHEQFLTEAANRYGDEYTILGQYVTNHTPIRIRHNTCGHEWDSTSPYDFLKPKSNTCKACSHQSWAHTTEEYKLRVRSETSDEYIVKSDYINNKTRVKYEHVICGTIWETRPDLFNQGHRCPTCGQRESKLSVLTERILTENNILFEKEKTFDGFRHKLNLFIDFFLPNHSLAIECDGDQHYHSKRGGDDQFMKTLIRDKVKRTKCKELGIELIRIPSMLSLRDAEAFIVKHLFELDVLELAEAE
jgi:very-short-patch-repair endonuclease